MFIFQSDKLSLFSEVINFRAFGHELTLTVFGIETVSTVYFAESDYLNRNFLSDGSVIF